MEPQQVVLGQSEATDRCFGFQAAVRAMPIVAVHPGWQLGSSLYRGWIGDCVGPFPERGLDEAFGFAIGPGRIRLGSDVFEAEIAAGSGEGPGPVAGLVIVMTRLTVMPRLA